MRLSLIIFVFVFLPLLLNGQVEEVGTIEKEPVKTVIANDTLVVKDTVKTDTISSSEKAVKQPTKKKAFSNMTKPKKAFIFSMIIPGAGQVYNGQWYKAPVIYGGIVGLVYLLKNNKDNYELFKEAYLQELHGEEHVLPQFGADQLLFYRKKFFKKMELNYIELGALYFLNGIDAYVSAHLLTFDVSDDLSLRVSPKVFTGNTYTNPGMGVRFSFSLK